MLRDPSYMLRRAVESVVPVPSSDAAVGGERARVSEGPPSADPSCRCPVRRPFGFGLVLLLVGLSSGCAVGHKVAYTEVIPRLNMTGTEAIGLAVHDQRRHVVSQGGSPEFVGEMRSLYHIPYGVHTAIGKPLADDLASTLWRAFTQQGFMPVLVSTTSSQRPEEIIRALSRQNTPRGLLLTLYEWRTDTYFKTQLFYELGVTVVDHQGAVLAQERVAGHEEELTKHPAIAFQEQVQRLLDQRTVSEALTRSPPALTAPAAPAQGAAPAAVAPPPTSWRVFSYAPGMTERTALAEPAPSIESCRLLRNALEAHHPGRILTCEIVQP